MTAARRAVCAGAAFGLLAPMLWSTPATAQDAQTMPIDTLIERAPKVSPDALFVLAARLFAAGRRDEAVGWFYIAQIRMRFRLAVALDLPPDGEPALYGALFETIGPQINLWAFGDIDRVATHMQEALDWDNSHANAFTPKSGHAAELEQVRSGLAAFRANVLTRKEEMRRERAAKDLENR
ncbi:MAG TPA: hypothetical protein VGC09_16250 [Rhodopila sp.]